MEIKDCVFRKYLNQWVRDIQWEDEEIEEAVEELINYVHGKDIK